MRSSLVSYQLFATSANSQFPISLRVALNANPRNWTTIRVQQNECRLRWYQSWQSASIRVKKWWAKPIFTRTWLRYVRLVLSQFRLSSVCRSVCNVGAPYSQGWTFRQNFFTAVYAGHPLSSVQNFTAIVPGEPLRRGR